MWFSEVLSPLIVDSCSLNVSFCFQKMSVRADDVTPVTCTIKPPVYLQIGDTKTDAAHSGVCVVDVALPFGKPVNVSCCKTHTAVELMQGTKLYSVLSRNATRALLSSTVLPVASTSDTCSSSYC